MNNVELKAAATVASFSTQSSLCKLFLQENAGYSQADKLIFGIIFSTQDKPL